VRRICVFCGSSPGADPVFEAAARCMGRTLAAAGIGLVFGGGSVGLMGAVADAALAAGGDAIGVIPRSLWEREIGYTGLTDLRIVGSMHERKALMADLSDGFIALPGGIGTLEELFEVWTWAQLGVHAKPVDLLNVAGFFDPLLAFLDATVEQRFLRPEHRALVLVEHDPAALLRRFATYVPPDVPKWIDRAAT
jgi:uncharacterized protein (TIGR00730 family)